MAFAPRNAPLDILTKSGAPLTLALIACNVVTLILGYAIGPLVAPAFAMLQFAPAEIVRQPWTLFTYPAIAGDDWLQTGLSCLMMWWFGASLERAWGTRAFALFFAGVSAAFALSLLVGMLVLAGPGPRMMGQLSVWHGLWLPTFGVVVGWAMTNPAAIVNLWGILPLKAVHVALLDAFILWFTIREPMLGLFAQGGNLAAWGFVAWRPWNRYVGYREPRSRRQRPDHRRDEGGPGWNPLAQWEERKRREKLEALFRNSGYDDREDPPPTLH